MMPLDNSNFYIVGDIHGDFNFLVDVINRLPKETTIVQVGDFGMGFDTKIKNQRQLKYINSQLEKNNQKLYAMRGNHDDPKFFNGDYLLSNLELLPDYSVRVVVGKICLFIGGGISVDRCKRVEGGSYWKDEAVKLEINKIQKCDILFTHTGGTKQYPQTLSNFVYRWAEQEKKLNSDSKLLEELKEEKIKIDKIIEISNPDIIYRGHFHCSHFEEIGRIKDYLLNINEIKQVDY